MLIDSGSEMNVMSKGLWKQAQGLLPIDTDIQWAVGSAISTFDRIHSVCHSVMVDIGGKEITRPVFVLEGASQYFIPGRPWERRAQAQYDNRDDRSLYISITSTDNKRRAIFCAVAEHSEWNRDRVRILRLEDPLEGKDRGLSGVAGCRFGSGDATPCYSLSFLDGNEEMEIALGDGEGASEFALVVGAMWQPILSRGEGSKELKRQVQQLWRCWHSEAVKCRIDVGRGNARTMYKRKAVKVVLVDKGYDMGEKPAGKDRWREHLIRAEKERQLDGRLYEGFLIPKFSTITRGERLTAARIQRREIGKELRTAEKELLLEMLYDRETAIAFNFSEKGCFMTSSNRPTLSR
jgi:hypothetical protein